MSPSKLVLNDSFKIKGIAVYDFSLRVQYSTIHIVFPTKFYVGT